MVFLYASGVFYSSSNVLEKAPQFWIFLKWNPLIHVIESLRRVTLWGQDINFSHLGYAWGFSLVVLLFGAWTFQALRPGFADAL
jgi:ABC-type polysaccharide/polyol phosphate export permease